MNKAFVLSLFAIIAPLSYADQGSFTNSGGSTGGGAGVTVTSNVATPAGTLTLNCPCLRGRLRRRQLYFLSNDGTTTINASFTSGTYAESCSGGGKGGHITCGYSFTGYFSGTLTVNGQSQAINGVTYQGFGTGRRDRRGNHRL